MCSKPNPEENEVCQFCQARLKPLIAGQPSDEAPPDESPREESSREEPPRAESSPPPPTSSPTEDLSRLRSQYEEQLPDLFPSDEDGADADLGTPLESTYEEPETSDEYLERLTQPVGTAATEAIPDASQEVSDPVSEGDEPVPEWLARIRQQEGDRSQASDQSEEEGDWLSRLREKEDGEAPPEGTAVEAEGPYTSAVAQSEMEVGQPQSEPVSDGQPVSTVKPAEPDQTPGGFEEAGQEAIKPATEIPESDWAADASASQQEPNALEDEPTASISPFASGPLNAEESQEDESQETPTWLANELEGPREEEDDKESLSWLESEVNVDLTELDSGAFMAVEPDDEVELPEWLAEAVDPTKAAQAAADEPEQGLLARLRPDQDADSALEAPPGEAGAGVETSLGPASKPFLDGTVEPESPPDISWEELKQTREPTSEFDIPSRPFVEEPQLEPEPPAEEEEDLGIPAWLDEIREPTAEPEEPEETPVLDKRPGARPPAAPKDSGLNLEDLELPEWIGDMRDESAGGAEKGPELAPATLPTWLEAMRPIESSQSDMALIPEDDQSVESIGPLAGLRGVLAAEPIMAMPRTATIGGARLEVNEQQYARAELLARMVQEEQHEQVELKPKRRRIPVARLLITLALLAALFLSLPGAEDASANRFLAPENQPQTLGNLYDLVLNAPLDRPVLVVFDYSPAYAGELETYATPLLADMVSRELNIITVSTHPTGPPLAARMLQNVRGDRELQNTRDYLHFGYLAGGPTAVQLFAANPRQALVYGFQLPVDTQTTDIWSYPIVQNISKLSDFGLLVVITAGTDSARTWVEQAGPYLGDTPLALVLSAGVEPLLQPYAIGVEPQVDNILSGLSVAYVYEGYMGVEGTARTNWDSFGWMLSVVELSLIGGALYGFVRYVLGALGIVKE
jgi:hypothetical protein